jgi:hypothetical protein
MYTDSDISELYQSETESEPWSGCHEWAGRPIGTHVGVSASAAGIVRHELAPVIGGFMQPTVVNCLNDLTPPVTADMIIEHREELIKLAHVINPWLRHDDLEDFCHEYYIAEKRRNRLQLWAGKGQLTSWILTSMRYYRGNVFKKWEQNRVPWDGDQPWSAWCSDTTARVYWDIGRREFSERNPMLTPGLNWLLEDKNQAGLDKWPNLANLKANDIRYELRKCADVYSDSTCNMGLQWQL